MGLLRPRALEKLELQSKTNKHFLEEEFRKPG